MYRARDTRLERVVAIKVLPPHLSTAGDVRQRFEREARTISQLSHPHICAIHDVGRQDGVEYLVMEFLEGETLAHRLAKGPLPLEQTLRWGVQVADALDRAHRQGIVHRDLKPGNVMLTKGGVKLLDFGLAKEMQAAATDGDTAMPTRASENLTEKGTILGTFQYMSPEQLEGREADARSDIFALGAVLYEMATGKKAFAGATQASLISSILRDEPQPIGQIAPMTPPALDRVVRTCLAKDPEERWQSAGDVAKELKWIAEGSAAGVAAPPAVATRRRSRERIAWIVAAVATAAAIGLAVLRPRPAAGGNERVLRTNVLLPERVQLNNAVLSPAGDRFVFSGIDPEGKVRLWVRSLDSYTATPLPGTEGGILPFWSPDARFIGFFADKKLKRIESSGGGAPLALYDVDGVGGAWAPNGDILFTNPAGPVMRLPSGGGKAVAVTKLDAPRHETAHRYPFLLPDGKHFLYLAMNIAGNTRDPANRIWVGTLDGAPAKPLIPANFNPQYGSGYLLFIRGGDQGGSLLAQPFDAVRLQTSGEPVTVAEAIGLYGDFLGYGDFSASSNGALLFDAFRLSTRLEWFDRGGKLVGTFGEPAAHFGPRISPDGSRVAFDVYDPRTNSTQIWLGDVARGVRTRLTSDGSNSGAVWSPDGSRIAFQTDRRHQADLSVVPAGGSGAEEAVTDEEGQKYPQDWSKDGRFFLAIDREAVGSRLMQVVAISTEKPHTARVVLPRSPNDYGGVRLSPDGRWIAYDVDESGRREVYVVSFPEGQGKVQISNAGGFSAHWTRGGSEIVYNAPDGGVMSVEIDAKNGLVARTPKPLFQLPEGVGFGWDVSADGERFLLNAPVVKSSSIPLSLVHNWAAGLPK